MTLIKIKDVCKSYTPLDKAIDSINLELMAHQRVAIVGETGSGKSTLLKLIAGLQQPDSGNVFYKKKRIKGPDEQLIPGHKSIAYLSQDYRLPNFVTVEEYLFDAYTMSDDQANEIYNACNVQHLLTFQTQHLSGGEKQRVALVKQLLNEPELLLLDEPFSNLDHQHKEMIKNALEDIEKQLDITIILIAHEPIDVLSWADKIIVMRQGVIAQQDTPSTIYGIPTNSYVAGLFGPYNLVAPDDWPDADNFPIIDGKNFIRPDRFELNSSNIATVNGTIKRVKFMGSYQLLEVKTSKDYLILQTETGQYQIGQEMKLSLKFKPS